LKLKKGVKFAYIKKDVLFFVLTHPVFKMEFTHSKDLVWSLLKTLGIANISDIQFFVTNVMEKKEAITEEKPFFEERSYGIFENYIEDKTLHHKIELIRKLIKNT
jgi:hypothetical protein